MATRAIFFSCLMFSWLAFVVNAERIRQPKIRPHGSYYMEDGSRVVLTCYTPTPEVNSYLWRHDGVDLPGEQSINYTIPKATIGRDDGKYTCFAYVDTMASEESDGYFLYMTPINNRLKFTKGSRPTYLLARGSNQSITMICSTSSVGEFTYCFNEYCSPSDTFTYTAAKLEKEGKNSKIFSCRAKNHGRGGAYSYTVQVKLVEKPTRPTMYVDENNQPKDGDRIRIFCQTSTIHVLWTWKFNGVILSKGLATKFYDIPKATIGYNEGNYTCIASVGEVSSDESENFTLSLQPRPPILSPSGQQTVKSGSTSVTLSCGTSSNGPFTYIFLKDSTQVQSSDSSTYTIDSPLTTDSGTYTCAVSYHEIVSNSTKSLNLTVEDIDECTEGTDNCGCYQVCINTDDSFYCTCRHGFTLASDNTTCQSEAIGCDNKVADIVFAIDNSAASGVSNYRTLLQAAGNFTQRFKLGPRDARFGALLYGDSVTLWFSLASFNNHQALYRFLKYAYNQPSQQPHPYQISEVLEYVKDKQTFSVVRGGRKTAKDVLILFVDDMKPNEAAVSPVSSLYSPSARARLLKNQGVEIITVCVGCQTLDQNFLEDLASDPCHVVTAANYSVLDTAMDRVANILCAN